MAVAKESFSGWYDGKLRSFARGQKVNLSDEQIKALAKDGLVIDEPAVKVQHKPRGRRKGVKVE